MIIEIALGIVLGVFLLCVVPPIIAVLGYALLVILYIPIVIMRGLRDGLKTLKVLFIEQMREPISPARMKPLPRWKYLSAFAGGLLTLIWGLSALGI